MKPASTLRALAASLVLLACAPRLPAQSTSDPEVLKSRALDAIRRATIAGGDLQPYRLTALITTYDGAGKNPLEGTVTILRRGAESRIDVRFPEGAASSLYLRSGEFQSTSGHLPYYAARTIRRLQQPVEFAGFDAASASPPAEGKALDCIALTASSANLVKGPLAPQHELCLAPPHDEIRLLIDGDEVYLRDNVLPFAAHDVARRLRLRLGGITVSEIIISSLDPAVLTDADFKPSPDMKPTSAGPTRLAGSIMAGRILKHDNPKYPGVAKSAHLQGIVVVHAIIGKDGKVETAEVISSPDPILSESSLKAVRKWTYEPYLLNGQPTEIDTTISVNFSTGPQK